MGCVKDSTIQEVVSQIQTSTTLSARQKEQVVSKMLARATPRQQNLINKLLAEDFSPAGSIAGQGSTRRGDQTKEHPYSWWKDSREDSVRHSESYDVDEEGNVIDYHYSQKDEVDKSQIGYNYHSGKWFDNTKGDNESGIEE